MRGNWLAGGLAAVFAVLGMAACSDVNCSSQGSSYANYVFADRLDSTVSLLDTLSVGTTMLNGKDTVLLNRLIGAKEMSLPVSSSLAEDTLYFYFFRRNQLDTLWIRHSNVPYFSSPECGISVAHSVEGVRYTRHFIDTVQILNKEISAKSVQNFKIRFNVLATDTEW